MSLTALSACPKSPDPLLEFSNGGGGKCFFLLLSDVFPLPLVRRRSPPLVFSTSTIVIVSLNSKKSMGKFQLKSLRELDSEEGTVKLVDGNCSLTMYTR